MPNDPQDKISKYTIRTSFAYWLNFARDQIASQKTFAMTVFARDQKKLCVLGELCER
jgi:hypothetical protein